MEALYEMFPTSQIEQDFVWLLPTDIKDNVSRCKGDYFQNTFDKIKKIIGHQFNQREIRGIKGFILHGPAGTGKTLLVKVLGKDLYVPVLFVDGSTVARSLYGQSEEQVREIFKEASSKKSIILIDDAESVFPDREWSKGQSWHVAQNNILLHELDNIDTSKTIVIMTTNKYNMLDPALKDRLYSIEMNYLDEKTLFEIAEEKASDKNLVITDELKKEIKKCASVREIERIIEEKYIDEITNKPKMDSDK